MIMEYYLDLATHGMMSDKDHRPFFIDAATNTHNRELYPYRYRKGAILNLVANNEFFQLAFLEPEESGDAIYNRLTGGKFNYNSFNDIDRYLLKCSFGNMECQSCPAWQKLREILAVSCDDISVMMGDRHFARIEDDPAYGEVGKAYVCNGNGAMGPIARKPCLYRWHPFAPLEAICKGCEYRRNHTDNYADQGKVIRGKVSTDGVADGAERVKCDDEKLVHGRIIAFLKRIFGR